MAVELHFVNATTGAITRAIYEDAAAAAAQAAADVESNATDAPFVVVEHDPAAPAFIPNGLAGEDPAGRYRPSEYTVVEVVDAAKFDELQAAEDPILADPLG